MGVKDLWSIIAPVGRHMPLKDLSGQTLAVDLSIWVCETQGVKRMQGVVTKPHLRNLFFRISHLSQLGVKLVFAIEGAAPDLKLETMSKRQKSQFSARSTRVPKAGSRAKKPARSHFNSVLRECCEMLDCLGIPYVQSKGEAEAMCAVLNSHRLVDGCLTNDGDAFLYGARVVYRNFTMNTKDPHVEMFRMDDLEQELGLNREKLVAMAILLGCDYMPQGVPGVGRELAGKLMQAMDGVDVLKRMEGWRLDPTLDDLEAHAGRKKVSHCVCCRHPGSQRHHDKWGCTYCRSDKSCTRNGISCPCEWHKKQHQVELRAAEFSIRQKAMKLPNFPPENVIQEFMLTKDKVTALRLTWKRPKLFHFQRLSSLKLEWEEEYSLSKVLPLLTIHDMTALLEHGLSPSVQPHAVIKSRVRQGVSCYEVAWNKLVGDTTTETEFYVTVEPQDLFARCFPLIVQQFEKDAAAKRKGPSKGKSKKTAVEAVKQMTDDDTAIADVTSGLSRLQLHTEGVERGDTCVFTGASAAEPRMQGIDGDEDSDDSCILLDTPSDIVKDLGNSPTQSSLERVSTCDSDLLSSPVSDVSNTNKMNSTEDAMLSGTAEEHNDDDDDVDVFLSLSERLHKQKVALKAEAGRKPLTMSRNQDMTVASVTRIASLNSAAAGPVSDLLAVRQNYDAGANELSVVTNQLPSAAQQLCSPARQTRVKKDDSFKSSQCIKRQTEDNKSPKANGYPTRSSQEVSADRHHEQNDVCFDLHLPVKDTEQECLVEHLYKKSHCVVVDSLETKASGIHCNAHVHQISHAADDNSDSCTDDKLGNSSDIKECTERYVHISPPSHKDTQSKCLSRKCTEDVECSPEARRYSSSRNGEKTHSRWSRDVIMSPDLFDSYCDDDDSVSVSTLTPSVGTTWNRHDNERSLCGISHWDVETPMHSGSEGHDSQAGHSHGDRFHSEASRLGSSFELSSFSCNNLLDRDCSPTHSSHISSIRRTALDDSAFVSCDCSTTSTDSNSMHTHNHSQSLGDSVCGDIGDFKLCSSLLCESEYLSDSTDLNDSVFMCEVKPSALDNMDSNRSLGLSSRCSSNVNAIAPCQDHCHKTNDTPLQTFQGHSDIALNNSPIKCDIQATCNISTVTGDISPLQVNSPVCLADRLKLRLAKTNKAYLVNCLSRDITTTGTSVNKY